ncbi:MAG: lytic transglycosylase [Bradyrhizobium sp.]|nr:lytic transglycosylase [Bradyrhizobium sp.]
MRVLLLAAFAGMALPTQRAPAQTIATAVPARNAVPEFVTEAAHRFAIPEGWIYAVMRVESAGDPRAVSPKGATGLMQIMPGTWLRLRVRYRLGSDIYDPHDNIVAGAGYLRELYDRYGSPGFLAAYNAGPARYEAYRAMGVPLPGETIAYVQKLAPVASGEASRVSLSAPVDPTAWTRAALFAGASRNVEMPTANVVTTTDVVPDVGAPGQGVAAPPPRVPNLFISLSGQARR